MAVRSRRRTSALGRMPPVAKWAFTDCFEQSKFTISPSLKFQEFRDRQSLRFCGQSDVLCNDRPVVAHQVVLPLVSERD